MGNYHVRFRGRGRGQSHWEPSPLPDELGGLVVKARLVDLIDDDRATLYGAFLTVADRLHSEDKAKALALWQRKGKRAFEAEKEVAKATLPSS